MRYVQVLGPGCPNCTKLAGKVEAAVRELDIEAKVEKVTDITQIVNSGVLMTPALVIDGKVKMEGKVPSTEEIKQWLS